METTTLEPKKMNMLEIQIAIKNLFEVSENLWDEDAEDMYGDQLQAARAQVEKELETLAEMEADKIDAIVYVLLEKQARISFFKQYEHMMANKRRTIENEIDHMKSNMKFILESKGLKKIQGDRHSIGLRTSKAVVIDVDPEKLPEAYVTAETTYKPDKMGIKKAIQAGREVEGAHIEERQSVQYK